MICPICGGEMEEGGLIASGISAMWFPTGTKQFAEGAGACMRADSQSESRTTFSTIPRPGALLPRLPENNRHFRYFP